MQASSNATGSTNSNPSTALLTAVNFTSGALSATVSKTMSAPLDRMKLMYQTGGHDLNSMQLAKHIYRNQGILSFWRGNVPNVLRYFPMQAFMLTFKEHFRSLFAPKQSTNPSVIRKALGNVAAASLAGVCALTIVYPLDLARTRMAVDSTHSGIREFGGSMNKCILHFYRHFGLASLFSGYVSGSLCYFVYRGCQMGGYDTLKMLYGLDVKKAGKELSIGGYSKRVGQSFALSMLCTCVAASIAYPFDTVRRRCMMISEEQRTVRIRDSVRLIHSQLGIAGFYRGLGVNYARNIGGALVLVLFDVFKPGIERVMTAPFAV